MIIRENLGGQFTFPIDFMTKAQKRIVGNKKRNPAIPKSPYPNYKTNRIISKASSGKKMELDSKQLIPNHLSTNFNNQFQFFQYKPASFMTDGDPKEDFSDKLQSSIKKYIQTKAMSSMTGNPFSTASPFTFESLYPKPTTITTTSSKKSEITSRGTAVDKDVFNSNMTTYMQAHPDDKKYVDALYGIGGVESNYKMTAQNPRGAYGWFQFVQNDSLQNVSKYGGVDDPAEFMKNGQLQIEAAVKKIKEIESELAERPDLIQKARELGYDAPSIFAGAWLGGMGGVEKVLNGTGNPADADGATVKDRMDMFKDYYTN